MSTFNAIGVAGTGVTEHLGALLPLETVFRDEAGTAVRLGDYFDRGKPVLLTFNYSDCPGLCSLQLNGLTRGLSQLEARAGRDYTVVSITIDPKEPWTRARDTKAKYAAQIRPGDERGWHFLTGSKASIDAIAAATGFTYKHNPRDKSYSHPATLVAVTPDGRVSGYRYDVHFQPNDLNRAITQAAAGESRSLMAQVILNCFHALGEPGKSSAVVLRITLAAGLVTVCGVALLLVPAWLRRNAVKASQDAADRSSSTPVSPPPGE